jgi:hypothetical protein
VGVLGRITNNLTVGIDGVVAAIRNENLPNSILDVIAVPTLSRFNLLNRPIPEKREDPQRK